MVFEAAHRVFDFPCDRASKSDPLMHSRHTSACCRRQTRHACLAYALLPEVSDMTFLDTRKLMVALATLVLACSVLVGARAANDAPELRLTIDAGTRLLVLAPHPDDEALGAAGLMHRVKTAGGSVRVVLMTSGDAFPEGVMAAEHIRRPGPRDFRRYGSLRERETIAATAALGIDRAHVWFLGFPDEGMCPLASEYLSA